ncbi:MAG: helix-turn-helix domain-containing protein [Candidatus Nanopelagicales bacterium]
MREAVSSMPARPSPQNPSRGEPDLTIAEVAALRRVSAKTIRRAIARGDLPAGLPRGSGVIRIRRSDAEQPRHAHPHGRCSMTPGEELEVATQQIEQMQLAVRRAGYRVRLEIAGPQLLGVAVDVERDRTGQP